MFYVVGFFIIIYSLKNYKKALMLYIAFKLFLVTNITILSIPGFPLLTLEDFMNCTFVLLYFKKSKLLNISKLCIPFQTPFILMLLSITISMIFAVAGVFSEISVWLKYIFENFLFILIVWNCIENEKDFIFIFKLITIVMFASCIYAIVEFAIQSNPLTIFEQTLNKDSNKLISYIYKIDERGYRVNSIFEHAIGAGINWGLYFAFVLSYLINKKEKLPFSKLSFLTMCLSIICMLLTKMRSGILFTGLVALGALNFKKKRTYVFSALGILFVFLIMSFFGDDGTIMKVFGSLFTGDSVGGSSIEMRAKQLDNAIALMEYSPIYGLGQKYTSVISNQYVTGLLGSESIWFFVIPCFGLLGIIAWGVYFTYLVIKVPKYYKSRQIFFVGLAYLITNTMSSVPGMKLILLYLYIFYFIKSSEKYQKFDGQDRKKEINFRKMLYRKIY